MIQDNEKFEVEGCIGGTKYAMGIAESAHGIVMDILSNMYADKQLAMVREYSTNAHDAHIEAGQTLPIQVTLPGALSPFLKIRDLGVGLTVDGIERVYSQYGASTKRDSNDQNGTFGIGCKAALAYCSQFTVTSVKDGVKIVVAIGREENGGGSMSVVDSRTTDEPNGTEVTIPIARGDIDLVVEKARKFYRFWAPGTVLVNDREPERFDGLKLSDDLFILEDEPDDLVVMGNVPYPAPQLAGLVPGASLVAFVPIGAVNIPPPRESLQDTRTTRDTIVSIKQRFSESVKGAIQREISAAPTPQDALRVLIKWGRIVPNNSTRSSDYTYNGATLPTIMRLPAYDLNKAAWEQSQEALFVVSRVNDYRAGYSRREGGMSAQEWPTTLWITGFTPDKYTAQHKRKMLKYCEENGLVTRSYYGDTAPAGYVERFVMVRDDLPATPFIDSSRIVAWDVVKKVKLEVATKTVAGVPRIPGSYDIFTEGGFEAGVPGDDFRQEHPILYYQGNRWEANYYNDALKVYYPHYTLVCLALNRVAKFNRILPSAKEAGKAIQDQFDTWAATVTEDQKKALSMHKGDRRMLRPMDAGEIDDPDLQDAVRIAKIDVSSIEKALGTFDRYADTDALNVELSEPFEYYPLIEWGRATAFEDLVASDPQHIYTYINAAYAAR